MRRMTPVSVTPLIPSRSDLHEGRMGRTVGRRISSVVAGAMLASLLVTAGASAEDVKRVAKVAPGVYMSKISVDASRTNDVRSNSEPGQVLEAKRGAGPSSRIVGGSPTTIGEWPWQAAILFDPSIVAGDGFDRQFCGGSLVTSDVVVSAAHCAFD